MAAVTRLWPTGVPGRPYPAFTAKPAAATTPPRLVGTVAISAALSSREGIGPSLSGATALKAALRAAPEIKGSP